MIATIGKTIRSAMAGIADLILPGTCTACTAGQIESDGLCSACNIKLLELVSLKYCPRCGASVGPNIPVREDGCWLCPNPLPRFTKVVRLGPYTQPLRRAVQEIKYHRRDSLCRRLVNMLSTALMSRPNEYPFELVMPVPMHWRRRLVRTCDHARMIARGIARELALPLGDELIRIRHTPPQVHLSRSGRVENVRGAFAVTKPDCIEGAHVLLVDDVTTTGATANEVARTLLAGGASKVTLAVIAKAEPPAAYAEITGPQ